ncbi:MAG: Crp/Fnr family transcriptional regulator [Candidatus Cryptobacteroides sp.]
MEIQKPSPTNTGPTNLSENEKLLLNVTKMEAGCFAILRKEFSYVEYAEDTAIIKPGDVNYNIYIILKGIADSYCINKNGERRYIYIQSPGFVVTDSHTLVNGQPAREFYVMCKNSSAAVIDSEVLRQQALRHPEVADWYIRLLHRGLGTICSRLESFIRDDAKERLINLFNENPELFSKALKKKIAGYLGIEPSTLSRLLSSKL